MDFCDRVNASFSTNFFLRLLPLILNTLSRKMFVLLFIHLLIIANDF